MDEEEIMYGICPKWAFFEAIIAGEAYVFDLRDVATQYAIRRKNEVEPVHINPVTMAPFHPKTRNRMFKRFDLLLDEGRLPRELSIGWQ